MIATIVHTDGRVLVNRLSRLLGDRRMAVQDLARGTGLSYGAVLDLYHDRSTRIDIATLDKICTFLSVTPNDVFEWVPPPDGPGDGGGDPSPSAARAE